MLKRGVNFHREFLEKFLRKELNSFFGLIYKIVTNEYDNLNKQSWNNEKQMIG